MTTKCEEDNRAAMQNLYSVIAAEVSRYEEATGLNVEEIVRTGLKWRIHAVIKSV